MSEDIKETYNIKGCKIEYVLRIAAETTGLKHYEFTEPKIIIDLENKDDIPTALKDCRDMLMNEYRRLISNGKK
ncbi:MAG: hypothetical protein GWP19_07880 [Planctomycetia bacterium]|nr:hypothetical protein [Planctomycetia bacterium]